MSKWKWLGVLQLFYVPLHLTLCFVFCRPCFARWDDTSIFPGKWRGRTLWSGRGSMVANNVILPYRACGLVTRYMSTCPNGLSVACKFMSIFYKKMKNANSSEYDRWGVETQLRKLRDITLQTRSLGGIFIFLPVFSRLLLPTRTTIILYKECYYSYRCMCVNGWNSWWLVLVVDRWHVGK